MEEERNSNSGVREPGAVEQLPGVSKVLGISCRWSCRSGVVTTVVSSCNEKQMQLLKSMHLVN